MLLGERDGLGVGEARVLDRVDAGANRILDPRGAVGVHGDTQSQHVGLIDDRLHLRQIELLRADGVGLRKHAAGAAELDDLGAVLVQFAHHGAQLLGAVRDCKLGVLIEGGYSLASQCPPVAPIA